MGKSYKAMIQEYTDKYGDIPLNHDEILLYLHEKMNITEKDMMIIEEEERQVSNIPWDELQIILPIIPKPSPRPRHSSITGSFYVTGASENKKLFKYYIENIYNIIYTQTHFNVVTYLPTPVSQMSRRDILRAERGSICTMSNPDWDKLSR